MISSLNNPLFQKFITIVNCFFEPSQWHLWLPIKLLIYVKISIILLITSKDFSKSIFLTGGGWGVSLKIL